MRSGSTFEKNLPPLPIGATSRAPQLREPLQGKDPKEHFQQVEGLLQSLGYQAQTDAPLKKELSILTAHHSVCQDLAINHPGVCAFDNALLEHLVDPIVNHQECMPQVATLPLRV